MYIEFKGHATVLCVEGVVVLHSRELLLLPEVLFQMSTPDTVLHETFKGENTCGKCIYTTLSRIVKPLLDTYTTHEMEGNSLSVCVKHKSTLKSGAG